ncbi:DUF285 domain-containing protein, partial [Helicobacter sp. faydin-H17]
MKKQNLIFVLFPLLFFMLFAEHQYFPKDKNELLELLKNEKIKLDEIDVSKITDMSELFCNSEWKCQNSAKNRKNFSGIESWDVSNVENMEGMFQNVTSFNQPLDKWNVA